MLLLPFKMAAGPQSCGPIWRAMRPGADQFVPAHLSAKMEQAP
jgi:hypothetical protein